MNGWRSALVAAAGAALCATVGCGGDPQTYAEPTPKATILVRNGAYDPTTVRIPVGGRVTFVATTSAPSTAETDRDEEYELDREKLDRLEQFDTHALALGEAQTVEFDTPGTYPFHSSFDGAMWGSVEVVEPR